MRSRGTRRPAGGRLPLLVASGVAMLVLGACNGSASDRAASGDATPVAADASTAAGHFELDLTHGIPSPWESRRATVEHGDGEPSDRVRIDADGRAAYVSLAPAALGDDQARFHLSGRFRVGRRTAGETVGLATVENSAHEHHADLFVDRRSGRCRVDLFQDDTAMSPHPCDDGRWHRVTISGDYGSATYTLTWTLDGIAMPPIRSTAQPAAAVHRLWLGDATPGKTNVTDWTDVTLQLEPS